MVEILFIPEIIVTLNFEREMGVYFKVTSRNHGRSGVISERPEFRTMDIYTLWFVFLPFLGKHNTRV